MALVGDKSRSHFIDFSDLVFEKMAVASKNSRVIN